MNGLNRYLAGVLAAALIMLALVLTGAGPAIATRIDGATQGLTSNAAADTADAPAQPYIRSILVGANGGTTTGGFFFVPAGKRLVIERVSFYGYTTVGQPIRALVHTSLNSDLGGDHPLELKFEGKFKRSNSERADYWAASEPMRLYANPGTSVAAALGTSKGPGEVHGAFTFSGYLLNVP